MTEIVVTLLGGLLTAVASLAATVTYLYRELGAERERLVRCREGLAQCRAEMAGQRALMQQMDTFGAIDAVVVADVATQKIVGWNMGATLLLHWGEREMLGKPLSKIIPERFRSSHGEAVTRISSSKEPPRRGPFDFFALTREGIEIPVSVTLSGWSLDGSRYMAATVTRRQVDPDADKANPGS